MSEEQDWNLMRNSIIGLGGTSSRKSFYPQLQKRIEQLEEAQENLRLSEQNLRTIFDSTHDAILIHDLKGRVLDANASALELYRVSRAQLADFPITSYMASSALGEGFPLFLERQLQRLRAEGPFIIEVMAQRPLDASTFEAEVGLNLTHWNGQLCIVAAVRDVTERKHLEGMLRQAQKLDALGQLAGGVAHDTNNMLGVIIGYVEILLENPALDDQVQHDLQQIQKAAQHSSDLTRQLLAFARKQAIQPQALNLDGLVSSSLSLLRRLIGENIVLAWEPGADPWTLWMDPFQIDQVLTNLVVNARDAVQGQGRITLGTHRLHVDEAYCQARSDAQPGDYLVLSVSDDGMGMSRETLTHIFEPFFTTKPVGRGTGLGLATVYGILGQNHGFITVQSEPEQGTTFRLHFPRYFGEEQIEEIPAENLQGGTEAILLVEDEPALLELSERLLRGAGYRVFSTGNPTQALELARTTQEHLDLLVTDLVMPGMDGRKLYEALNHIRPGLRSLYISGYPIDTITEQGILPKGILFLQKPFTPRELLSMVRGALKEELQVPGGVLPPSFPRD